VGSAAVVEDASADEDVAVVVGGWARDMDQDQNRLVLGLRSYRLGHRTPVLYSRNQSRTNIAL